MKFKNLSIILTSIFFGASIVGISFFRLSQAGIYAQEEAEIVKVIGEEEEEGTKSAEEKEPASAESYGKVKEVDYYLAYPGILPDHPLYWLKMIRDKIILTFTKDKVGRFNRLLLYADKRVGAAKALIDGGKVELGVTTATKAEKYLEQTVDQFMAIDDPGKATPEEKERLTKAILKHEEILTGVLEKVPDQAKAGLQEAITKAKELQEKMKG